MDRIPTEVWAMVFGNLDNCCDIQSVYNTCQSWRNVLQPSWMFCHLFAHLEQYLSVSDALKCRTVCKDWLAGVDSYLLTHAHCRPTFEQTGSLDNLYKTDERLDTDSWPSRTLVKVAEGCEGRRDAMVCQVPNYSSSLPLVGRWFNIRVPPEGRQECEREKEFLDSLGSHIWFLSLNMGGEPISDSLKIVLEYLSLFPNLKGFKLDFLLEYSFLSSDEERLQLRNYLETPPAVQLIQTLPRFLERVEMRLFVWDRFEECKVFKQIFVELLMSTCKNLQSVDLGVMSDVACLETGNILDLSVNVSSYAAVQQMLRIKSPIRRLHLSCDHAVVPPECLFRIAKHFGESLRNFNVKIDCTLGKFPRDDEFFERYSLYLKPLVNQETLKDLKTVKRMTVQGFFLLSFNFLCGLSRSLEYLHILLVFKRDSTDDHKFLTPFVQRIPFTEELDLLEGLRQFSRFEDRQVVYDCNVWKVFPKLRALTVQCAESEEELENPQEFQFRRDNNDYEQTKGAKS